MTIVLGYVAYNSPTFQKIFVNLPVIIVLSVALMALTCAMACFHDQFKKCALPFYITFTVIFALLIAISICGFRSKVVLLAAGITFAIVTVLTLYACTQYLSLRLHQNRPHRYRSLPADHMLCLTDIRHNHDILARPNSPTDIFMSIGFAVLSILGV